MDTDRVIRNLMDELYEMKLPFTKSLLFTECQKEAYMEMRRKYYGHPAVEEWFEKKHKELIGR